MTTLDFARKFIRFDKTTPITGPFRDEYYPFLKRPMEAADDIRVKRLVIFKAASCMGTVLGQIINAKRIVCDVGDQIMVCQTDEKAEQWTKTRGKEWLNSIPDVLRLLSRDKYSVTNSLWLFRHKWLMISGPGVNKAQSDQARFLQTDESHLLAFEEGSLVEWEKRLGGGWSRQATHITTAPDEGREVDVFFQQGQQDEWHFRCSNRSCNNLIWPLWGDYSKNKYDQQIFIEWKGEVIFKCPYCGHERGDNSRARYDLVRRGDYVAQNPSAPIETRSFRWPVWAAHWISWREMLSEHNAAMEAAKLGNLRPLEDFTKKRLAISWRPFLPDFGDGKGASDYKLGDEWEVGETVKILTADFQAGKGSEGAHIHALVTQWSRTGDSRRIAYRKLETFGQLESMQREFAIEPKNVAVDSGFESRLVFRECGRRKYYCTRGSDAPEILHTKSVGKDRIVYPMPYSQTSPQSGIVGEKQPDKLKRVHRGSLPEGWAYQITLANPALYGYLSALIGGGGGRYWGVAKDFPPEYMANMPAFIAITERDKKTNRDKVTWRKVREDHWWDMECIAIVMAARAGYFPFAGTPERMLDNPTDMHTLVGNEASNA